MKEFEERYEQLNRELTEAVKRFEADTSWRVRHISVNTDAMSPPRCDAGVCYGDVPQERVMLTNALAQVEQSTKALREFGAIAVAYAEVVKEAKSVAAGFTASADGGRGIYCTSGPDAPTT